MSRVLALLCCVLVALPAYGNRALVIGVDTYPHLKNAQLQGCSEDARKMADALRAYDMRVTLLVNSAATKERVKASIGELAQANKDERIVFYFAGHGSRTAQGEGVILPYDSMDGTSDRDISASELSGWMRACQAGAKSVLLDTCFSGAMARAIGKTHLPLRPRFYLKEFATTAAAATSGQVQHIPPGGDVCYFTAAQRDEEANEGDCGDGVHGLFTYAILQNLKVRNQSWSSLQQQVSKYVNEKTEDLQHPALSASYSALPIFGPKSEEKKAELPVEKTIWDLYNRQNPETDKISISVSPNRRSVSMTEHLQFKVRVGTAGYLVLIDRDSADKLQVIYPAQSEENSLLSAGTVVTMPPSGYFTADRLGSERVMAILFGEKATAEAVIRAFARDAVSRADSKSRTLDYGIGKLGWFYTADLMLLIEEATLTLGIPEPVRSDVTRN